MEKIELQGNLRTETGKGSARQLRRDGLIPGIVYGNKENIMVSINHKEIAGLLQKAKANTIFNLKIEKNKDRTVVIKELQKKVIHKGFLHVDLLEISMDKKLKISVPIEESGTAIGIKMGGILTHTLREIKVECLPTNIPQSINIDVSNLDVGQTMHIRDIETPEGVTILNNSDETVCAVSLAEAEKSKETVEAEAAEVAATAEAPTDAAADTKEKTAEDKSKEKGKEK